MSALILVIQLVLALMLIGIVLIQRTNQSGLGLGDGGSGGGLGGMMSGRSQANMLTRATAFIATAFIIVCILSAILAARGSDTGRSTSDIAREVDRIQGESSEPGPATPEGTALPSRADDAGLLDSLGTGAPAAPQQ